MIHESNAIATVFDLTNDLPEIRPFPETATRIIAACDDPAVTASELCEVAQCDPGVALRILRVANSSAYGCSGVVRSLQHAVVVLGFRALRTFTVSMAVADTFKSGGVAAQQRTALWNHSMACGVVASFLAPHFENVKPEEAFLAGIVHDAGKLVLLDAAAEQYSALAEQTDDSTIIAAEQRMFGIDHQQLGLRCADEWGLPPEVADAIGHHHTVLTEEIDSPIAKLTAVANTLCKRWGIGSHPIDDQLEIEHLLLPNTHLLDAGLLESIEHQAREQFHEMQLAVTG